MTLPQFAEKICLRHKLVLYLIIPLVSLLMRLHVFNRDLLGYHVWRQTQTQINIENFAKEDFNILNPRINNTGDGSSIFRMEFPIMQWLFACFFKLFGDHIIISRILSFIIGLCSIWGMYHLIHAIFNRVPISLIGAWCFTFSPAFYYYTLNPMPDNFALCMGIWSMYYFFSWVKQQKTGMLVASSVLLSIATLAKMPFAVYLFAVDAYVLYGLSRKTITVKSVFILVGLFIVSFIPAVLWYGAAIETWTGNGIVSGILSANKADIPVLLDIMQHNLISTMPELLVNYGSLLFFIAGFWFIIKNKVYKKPEFSVLAWWGIGVLLYFFFEMNMIAKVHDYYLFPFLPMLFILVAYGAEQLFLNVTRLKWLFVTALCIVPFTAFLRVNHRWSLEHPGFNPDLYQYKAELSNAVPNDALCVCGNDDSGYIFLYYIRKKGWNFDLDTLSGSSLKLMISKGAKYLYTDSQKVLDKDDIKVYLDKEIVQKGSVKVYLLKKGDR